MTGTKLELGLSLAGGEVGLEMVGGAGAGDTGLGGLQRVGRAGAGAGAGAAGGGAEPVRLFLPLALRRIAAACSIQVRGREEICDEYRIFDGTCSIQGLLRSYRFRRRLSPSLGTMLLHLRYCKRALKPIRALKHL